jgi:hypothetical protein
VAHDKRIGQVRQGHHWTLRVYHRKAHGKFSARYLVKCGCCDERVEIYYDDEALEINAVNGSLENWREVLGPLLAPRGSRDAEEDI